MFRALTRPSFLVGVTIGAVLAALLKLSQLPAEIVPPSRPFHYSKWIAESPHEEYLFDSIRYSNGSYLLESDYLRDKITVFCLVLVKIPKNVEAIQATWGHHCNNIQLVSLKIDKKKLPLKLNKGESAWVHLCKALKQVPEEFKWVLVVYDYTFALVENLRLFVASLDHERYYYFGHTVKFWSTVYNTGQAGYVLSKGTVDALKKRLEGNHSCLRGTTYRSQEDYHLGNNLAMINITPVDTRDERGFSTFHPYNLYQVLLPGQSNYILSVYPHKCCSPYSITFQGIEGDKMYTYYYLLYTLQRFFGGNLGNKPPIKSISDEQIWRNFLKARDLPENMSSEQYYKVWEDIVEDPTSFAKLMKRESFDYQ